MNTDMIRTFPITNAARHGVGDILHNQKTNVIFPVMDLPANDPSTHYRGKSPDCRVNRFSCSTMT
jgi:hypothetical protein